MKSHRTHVFAVIRIDDIDGLVDKSNAHLRITIKEVLATQVEAVHEVDRLNKLNADKGAFYFWQVTRYCKDDTAGGSS